MVRPICEVLSVSARLSKQAFVVALMFKLVETGFQTICRSGPESREQLTYEYDHKP